MTTTTTGATRCDRILALIDSCLADVDAGLRSIDLTPATVPSRHGDRDRS